MAGWKIRRHNWMDRRRGTSKKTDRLKTTGRSSDPDTQDGKVEKLAIFGLACLKSNTKSVYVGKQDNIRIISYIRSRAKSPEPTPNKLYVDTTSLDSYTGRHT